MANRMRHYAGIISGLAIWTTLILGGCSGSPASPNDYQGENTATRAVTSDFTPPSGASNNVFSEDILHEYKFTMSSSDADALLATARSDAQRLHQGGAPSKTYYSAKLVVDGQDLGEVGIRHKGSQGTLGNCFERGTLKQLCKKLSYKVKFDFRDSSKRLAGLKSVNLHSCSQDATILRERLGYAVFRDLGIPAPRSAHAAVYVNGVFKGVFPATENVDDVYVQERWGSQDEGYLYKDAWPITEDPAYYQSKLENRQKESPAPTHGTLVSFARELRQASSGASCDDKPTSDGFTCEQQKAWGKCTEAWFVNQGYCASTCGRCGGGSPSSAVPRYVNVPLMLRYMAADRAMRNWDGISRFYCGTSADPNVLCTNHNSFLHVAPSSGRVSIIPWDLDGTWYPSNEFIQNAPRWNDIPSSCATRFNAYGGYHMPAACDPVLRGIVGAGSAAYKQAVAEVLAGPLSPAQLQVRIDRWAAQIEHAAQGDPGIDYRAWKSAVAQLRSDMDVLARSLRSEADAL